MKGNQIFGLFLVLRREIFSLSPASKGGPGDFSHPKVAQGIAVTLDFSLHHRAQEQLKGAQDRDLVED
jgi:hypothetical protein